jgi:hypothetical protein
MALRIDTPDAAVAATPFLIGFPPEDSVVLLLLDEHDVLQVSMRVDLPPGADLGWLQSILKGIPDPVPWSVLIIVYADRVHAEFAQAVGMWVMHALLPVMEVLDLVLVSDGAYASMSRGETDLEMGRPLAPLADHAMVASCVAAGLSHVPSRADLVASLELIDDDVTAAVRRALRKAVDGDHLVSRDVLEERALTVLTGVHDLSPDDVACLARACRDIHIRDPLLALLLDHCEDDPALLGRARTRLGYCLTHTPGRHAGAVAATLAVLCWSDGDGAAALVAVDRSLEADPSNTLGPLVAHALQNGMPPDTWSHLTEDIPLDVLRGKVRRTA